MPGLQNRIELKYLPIKSWALIYKLPRWKKRGNATFESRDRAMRYIAKLRADGFDVLYMLVITKKLPEK